LSDSQLYSTEYYTSRGWALPPYAFGNCSSIIGTAATFTAATLYTPLYDELGGFVPYSFAFTSTWNGFTEWIIIMQLYTLCDGVHEPMLMRLDINWRNSIYFGNYLAGLGSAATKLSGFASQVCVQNFTLSSPLPASGGDLKLNILTSNGAQPMIYQVYFYVR
jgi:hypothetical protein